MSIYPHVYHTHVYHTHVHNTYVHIHTSIVFDSGVQLICTVIWGHRTMWYFSAHCGWTVCKLESLVVTTVKSVPTWQSDFNTSHITAYYFLSPTPKVRLHRNNTTCAIQTGVNRNAECEKYTRDSLTSAIKILTRRKSYHVLKTNVTLIR